MRQERGESIATVRDQVRQGITRKRARRAICSTMLVLMFQWAFLGPLQASTGTGAALRTRAPQEETRNRATAFAGTSWPNSLNCTWAAPAATLVLCEAQCFSNRVQDIPDLQTCGTGRSYACFLISATLLFFASLVTTIHRQCKARQYYSCICSLTRKLQWWGATVIWLTTSVTDPMIAEKVPSFAARAANGYTDRNNVQGR